MNIKSTDASLKTPAIASSASCHRQSSSSFQVVMIHTLILEIGLKGSLISILILHSLARFLSRYLSTVIHGVELRHEILFTQTISASVSLYFAAAYCFVAPITFRVLIARFILHARFFTFSIILAASPSTKRLYAFDALTRLSHIILLFIPL
jgi:hypothetical protein